MFPEWGTEHLGIIPSYVPIVQFYEYSRLYVCMYQHTNKFIYTNIYICEKLYSAEINCHVPFSFKRMMVYVHFSATFCMIYKPWAIYDIQLFNLLDCSALRKVINFSRMKYIIL